MSENENKENRPDTLTNESLYGLRNVRPTDREERSLFGIGNLRPVNDRPQGGTVPNQSSDVNQNNGSEKTK